MSGMLYNPENSSVLHAVDEVNWLAYAMPPSEQSYQPDRVPKAFRLLVSVSNREEGREAYNSILSATGNNHAGCLYPAAVAAAPLLARAVRELRGWPRWAALEVLIEYLAFDVDRDQFTDSMGSTINLRGAILAAVQSIREELEHLVREQVVIPTAESAEVLLEQLDEELG